MLFNPGTDYYWLASKCISTDSNFANFYVRSVNSGLVSGGFLVSLFGNEISGGIGLRPVVSLKSDIQLKKDGKGV